MIESTIKSKDAVQLAGELYHMSTTELPRLALRMMNHMISRNAGSNKEIPLLAFAWYAQAVENLPCEDPMFMITEEARNLFREWTT